jgi:glutamate synthase (ferredoxin)
MNQILEERDACGVGFIASLKGERTHKTVADALTALGCMEHRGACSADDDSGDGAGIMCNIPWKMLGKYCDDAGIRRVRGGQVRRRHGLPAAGRGAGEKVAGDPQRVRRG